MGVHFARLLVRLVWCCCPACSPSAHRAPCPSTSCSVRLRAVTNTLTRSPSRSEARCIIFLFFFPFAKHFHLCVSQTYSSLSGSCHTAARAAPSSGPGPACLLWWTGHLAHRGVAWRGVESQCFHFHASEGPDPSPESSAPLPLLPALCPPPARPKRPFGKMTL